MTEKPLSLPILILCMTFGPITDARFMECASCEREFDVHFPSRMQKYQKLHQQEQLHLWPCGFLERKYYLIGVTRELYDTPWEDEPKVRFFHSDECEEAYTRSGSFDYVDCEACGRTVCEQNPANGWMMQFREHKELGYVCLKCYETEILENGQPRSDFAGSRIGGGMFFSGDNREPLNAGYDYVYEFRDFFVSGPETARRFNRKALELIDGSHRVVTGYERLAIGGLEGYVSMFAKRTRKRGVVHVSKVN